jgi:hypothetical protein
LFQTELEVMNHFFPPFRPDRLDDGRMSWLGSLASDIPGSRRIWPLQLVYDHDHPHGDDYSGLINVFRSNRTSRRYRSSWGTLPHTLRRGDYVLSSICTVAAEAFCHSRDHSSTAASALAWDSKWITAFELWMLGDLSTEQFAGHRI